MQVEAGLCKIRLESLPQHLPGLEKAQVVDPAVVYRVYRRFVRDVVIRVRAGV